MQCKRVVLWSLINELEHPELAADDMKIENLMPMVSAMFPGINWYSVTGFHDAMHQCVMPALKTLHPELLGAPAEDISPEEMTEVAEVLPSNGYEWYDANWKVRLKQTLAA